MQRLPEIGKSQSCRRECIMPEMLLQMMESWSQNKKITERESDRKSRNVEGWPGLGISYLIPKTQKHAKNPQEPPWLHDGWALKLSSKWQKPQYHGWQIAFYPKSTPPWRRNPAIGCNLTTLLNLTSKILELCEITYNCIALLITNVQKNCQTANKVL